MSRQTGARRSSRRSLLVAVGFVFMSSLLSAEPVAAHVFIKNDANDSRGKLDLRSVSVSHTATGVVHTVTTYNAWTSRSLGADSFFIIQLDKNNDRHYERCAFIFYTNRLRGSLTNCGAHFIRFLSVSKVSGTTAKVAIPKSQTGRVYWWAGASLWDGPAPCGRGCIDFAPNNFPDILHDMIPPSVTMSTGMLRVWEPPTNSTSADFGLPFSVSDGHSGIKSWTVQRSVISSGVWTAVVSRPGSGNKEPVINGTEGTRLDYRVVARDKQGNTRVGPTRLVLIPRDDDNLGSDGVFSMPPTNVVEPTAFGGSYSQMAATDTFTYTWTPGSDCLFELIGPGGGPWQVTVTPNSGPASVVPSPGGGQRQTLYSNNDCSATEYVVSVDSGTFGLDAVLG
jgi:hypothetical protein